MKDIPLLIQRLAKNRGEKNAVAPREEIKKWGFMPPQDYIDFMESFVCGEGNVGKNSWLQLWKVEELIDEAV